MSNRRVVAIIPAAGRGRRLGRLKQFLPYGQSTMMETVIQTSVASTVDGVIVVVNDQVRTAAEPHAGPRCRITINPDPDTEMLTSILMAWSTAVRDFGIGPSDGLMILPADQPEIRCDVIDRTADQFRGLNSTPRIVIACYGGRRGHPAIYSCDLIESLRTAPIRLGLNELSHRHADAVTEMPFDLSVPRDVNSPSDYRQLTDREAKGIDSVDM